MIVNVGGRTDIVNHYTEWLLNRLDEGSACVRNPLFPHKVSRCQLDPSVVDCIVFCSKNYRPILPHMAGIADRYGVYCFYTITAYGTDIEPNIPGIDESIDTLIELSRIVGPQRVVWRYDPVLLTDDYSPDVHAETFDRIRPASSGTSTVASSASSSNTTSSRNPCRGSSRSTGRRGPSSRESSERRPRHAGWSCRPAAKPATTARSASSAQDARPSPRSGAPTTASSDR